MDVILSSGKVGHYYNTALALQREGLLKKFITTSYFKGDGYGLSSGLMKLLFGEKTANRSNPGISPDKVQPVFLPEAFARSLKLLPLIPNGLAKRIFNSMFDMSSRRFYEKCDIFFVAVTYALHSAVKAKESGSRVVLDMVNSHPHFCIKLFQEEAFRLGIRARLNDEYYADKIIRELKLADLILAPSDFIVRTLVEGGVLPSKIRVVPYGVDTRLFGAGTKSDDTFRVIFVGGLNIRKGIHYLLQAFRELSLPRSELVLIGKPASHMKPILKKYEGSYCHIPTVLHHQLNAFYSNSSVLVLPSLDEAFGLVVYEAMGCGIPVIITENCGAGIEDGREGFVIPIRDVEKLKEKILFLYENEERRSEMGLRARELAERSSWSSYQEKLKTVLEEAVRQQ